MMNFSWLPPRNPSAGLEASRQRLSRRLVFLGMSGLVGLGAIASGAALVSTPTPSTHSSAPSVQLVSAEPTLPESESGPDLPPEWRLMTDAEEQMQWQYILNSPMGIAALNQLAIEGFISPVCPKTFYVNEEYGGFQTLMVVKCPDPRGVSTAVGYDEIHVIFNRFESNIEGFEIQRFGQS